MNDDGFYKDEPVNASSEPDWEALARFLMGESSPDEAEHMRRWLDAHPAERAFVEQMRSPDSFAYAEAEPRVDVEAALARVHAQMEPAASKRGLTVERGAGRSNRRVTHWPQRQRFMVAGSLLAAAAVIIAVVLRVSHNPNETSPAIAAQTHSTRTGQRDSIMLADGSRVVLGPDSRLSIPADYGVRTRTVELDGDGYFDVQHDAAKPFAVRVANALIEDLGTTFLIESDAGDTTSVSVLTGSVRLRASQSAATDGAILAAGDRGSLTPTGDVRAYPHTVRADDASWIHGRVVLHDASLTRIAGELHRWYGINLTVGDSSLASRHVTTTFDDGDSADLVLESIALSLGGRVERQGMNATIYPNRGKSMVR